MSTSRSRIDVLAILFGVVALVIVGHLFVLMVSEHETWAGRSHQNRWAFRSVPSLRGSIRDRDGRVLAHDEATTELSLFYHRFRLRHPVGAAVHGATVWARLHPGRELMTYQYEPGTLGPEVAARDLLAIPVVMLRPDVLDNEDARKELSRVVVTVLSTTSGQPRRQVYKALREAWEADSLAACGEVLLEHPMAELLLEFERVLAHLRWFDAELAFHLDTEKGPLVRRLEDRRLQSLRQERYTWIDKESGEKREGHLLEDITYIVSDDVPFDLAAGLRLGARGHPGLTVRPSVRREYSEPEHSSLRRLLGAVKDLERLPEELKDFESYARSELGEDWIEEFLPEDDSLQANERERIRETTQKLFESAAMRNERGGWYGVEQECNAELSGHLGMRLIERDSKQREKWLWSNLRVRRGEDIQLTIDSELQRLVEAAVQQKQGAVAARHTTAGGRNLTRAAMALIDARSGEILAYAGAPITSPYAASIPGLMWQSDGAIGSLAKPFVLVEQLVAMQAGRPHTPLGDLDPCSGGFRYGGTSFAGCGDHKHYDGGKDPVVAVAKSCNLFFYQVAVGLGNEGVSRALLRFGLQQPDEGSTFAPCWQGPVRGVPYRGRVPIDQSATKLLPQLALGYGVAASPLTMARAYAGLATGRLPDLHIVMGGEHEAVSLGEIEDALRVVRKGLRGCVVDGTGKRVSGWEGLDVHGKTGTAEIGTTTGHENNAWFAGYLPGVSPGGVQLAFCAVVYWTPDGEHGADLSGGMIADVLSQLKDDRRLSWRYLPVGGGR